MSALSASGNFSGVSCSSICAHAEAHHPWNPNSLGKVYLPAKAHCSREPEGSHMNTKQTKSKNPRSNNSRSGKTASGSKAKNPTKTDKRRTAGKQSKRPPHKTLIMTVVIFAVALIGWFVGQYGPATWPLLAFFSAALWGLWYPAQLVRSLDQHKNIARQVDDKNWKGYSQTPLADFAAGLLLAAWIILLGLSLHRYPLPRLLSSTLGSLSASLGIVLRSGFTGWRKGVPTVPYEKEPLEKTIKITGKKNSKEGKWGAFLIAFVVLQAAAGQVLLGGTFGRVLLGRITDLTLGAALLSASGAEIVMLLVKYRLQPIKNRASTLLNAMK